MKIACFNELLGSFRNSQAFMIDCFLIKVALVRLGMKFFHAMAQWATNKSASFKAAIPKLF